MNTEKTKAADKVRKLLALAGSPVEAEAQAALLKARALMVEYKLGDIDVSDSASRVAEKAIMISTEAEFTRTNNAWVPILASVIAENFCCKISAGHTYNGKKYGIDVYGLESDAKICAQAINYAYAYVKDANERKLRKLKATYKSMDKKMSRYEAQQYRYSYGTGFADGMRAAFDTDKDEHSETALVLVVPEAVNDLYAKTIDGSKVRTRAPRAVQDAYNDGYEAGNAYKFPSGAISA